MDLELEVGGQLLRDRDDLAALLGGLAAAVLLGCVAAILRAGFKEFRLIATAQPAGAAARPSAGAAARRGGSKPQSRGQPRTSYMKAKATDGGQWVLDLDE